VRCSSVLRIWAPKISTTCDGEPGVAPRSAQPSERSLFVSAAIWPRVRCAAVTESGALLFVARHVEECVIVCVLESAFEGVDSVLAIGDAVAMTNPNAAPAQRIVRLVGVYDGDSSLRGELAYWIGARLGRRHCSLCDITHGSVRQRPEWKARQAALPTPFDTYHRNDQPANVRVAAAGRAPVVVAETNGGNVLLLGPEDLDGCGGSIESMVDAIELAAQRHGLVWTAA
jgi:hypothetical protein